MQGRAQPMCQAGTSNRTHLVCPAGAGETEGIHSARGAERKSSWQAKDGIQHSWQLVSCMTLGWLLNLPEPLLFIWKMRIGAPYGAFCGLPTNTSNRLLQETSIFTLEMKNPECRKDEWLGLVMWVSGVS